MIHLHVYIQGGIDEEEHEVLYVGCLPVEIDPNEQEVTFGRYSILHQAMHRPLKLPVSS